MEQKVEGKPQRMERDPRKMKGSERKQEATSTYKQPRSIRVTQEGEAIMREHSGDGQPGAEPGGLGKARGGEDIRG